MPRLQVYLPDDLYGELKARGLPASELLLLTTCDIDTSVDETTARRAAQLRFLARRGSAVDAIVVAVAEPHGRVLTGDAEDLDALASHADDVLVESI